MRRRRPPPDARVVEALGNPLRCAILVALNEREGSPAELARQLGEPVNLVAYHFRVLADAGAIELARTEPRRGSTEHYYRALMRALFEDREWAKLPVETRRAVFGQDIKRIVRDVRNAAAGTGLDDLRAHVSWTPLDLDDEAFDEVADLLRDTVHGMLEIQARVADRRAKRRDDRPPAHSTEVAILHFERAGRPTRTRRRS